ncbi:MAG TPA: PIG-L deacetylase family protein [Roseiflexaceae bacterium]|nr:PIG-L deacetylase family protein [Roseiflexaceae bacterium]
MTSLRHTPPPRSILAVAAHPDDIEFMAGGTLAAWIDQGTRVHYLLVTDGAGGSRDPRQTSEALAMQRRREQRAAAEILGVESVTFLGYPDAQVEASYELRLAIARVIRQVRPEAVLTFDPQLYYRSAAINHPDHLAVGASTLAAIMPLANTLLAAPALADEGFAPHDVETVYLFDPIAPTDWMPLTLRDAERKIAALQAHASQLLEWDGARAAYQAMQHTARAARANRVPCGLAEAFTAIRLDAPAPRAATPLTAGTRVQEVAQLRIAQVARSLQFAVARFSAAVKSH